LHRHGGDASALGATDGRRDVSWACRCRWRRIAGVEVARRDAAMRGGSLATRYRLVISGHSVARPVAGGWLATFDARGGLPVAGYASAVTLVFGAAGLVPVVLFVAVRAARRLLPRLAGVSGELAAGNLSGAIPRVGISVAALSVSLAMMVAIAVMVGSFRETVVYWVSQTLKADLFVGPSTRNNGARQSTLSAEVDAIVSAHPAVPRSIASAHHHRCGRCAGVPHGGRLRGDDHAWRIAVQGAG
jgi:hypothetical protein